MQIPHLIFTQYANSIKVTVENLESLEVNSIQKLQSFVQTRKGYFDFETYSFVLQKRLNYEEFQKIILASGIAASFEQKFLEYTKPHRIPFGQYKGLLYSELPDSYLIWLQGNYIGKEKHRIDKEMKKRGL